MTKGNFLIVLLTLLLFDVSTSVVIECEYRYHTMVTIENIYYCFVTNIINITSPGIAYVNSVAGIHQALRNNDDVEGFYVDKGTINYFPSGINIIFKNLKIIYIYRTGLKEIHQADLKNSPKLMFLYLFSNEIKVLEAGLFDYNPDLQGIFISENQISQIDANVFDKLFKLRYLWLQSNVCVNGNIWDNSTEVQNFIKIITQKCSNSGNLMSATNSNLESKLDIFMANLSDLVTEISNRTDNSTFNNTDLVLQLEKLYLPLNASFSNLTENFDKLGKSFNDKTSQLINDVAKINQNYANLNENIDMRLEIIDEDLNDLETFSNNKFEKIENAVKAAHFEALNANKAIDRIENNVLAKIDKIMKALNIKP